MAIKLERSELNTMSMKVIRQGSYSKPELRLYEADGEKIAVKDCSGMHPVIKFFMGRRTQNREIMIYKLLKGIRGVPEYKGSIDKDAFAVEFIDGTPLSRAIDTKLLTLALENLAKVIESIHARKVVHLDLKQKRNVLVRDDGVVAVIDFQSALALGDSVFGKLLFSRLKNRDIAGLLKFKWKYAPNLLSAKEQIRYKREMFFAKLWPFTYIARTVKRLFRVETD